MRLLQAFVLALAIVFSTGLPVWASYVIPDGSIKSSKLSQTTAIAIHGTSTNDNAAAGFVGEYFESFVARSSAVNCNSASTVDVASISLTAGDWDIGILAQIQAQASYIGVSYGISALATTLPGTAGTNRIDVLAVANATGDQGWYFSQRFSLSTTTTIYFDCKATASVLTYGKILARRVR